MSVMVFSDITLMEGVSLLSEQSENNRQLALALKEIYGHMEQGLTLSAAMGMYPHIFTEYLLNMLYIGETGGALDKVFVMMSEYFEKENRMRKRLRSAVTYPAVLSVLMGAIVLLMIMKVLPMFKDLLDEMGGDMPLVTNFLLSASQFIKDYWVWFVSGIAAVAAAAVIFVKTAGGSVFYDRLKLRIPVFKYVNTRILTARFARSLSILLKSGVQLINSLNYIKPLLNNRFLEPKFENAVLEVRDGKKLSESVRGIGIFPSLFLKLLHVGETTGRTDEMLDKAAGVFDEEVDEAIDRMTAFLEPLLIIILSVVVGIIMVSVMIPMITVMNAIG